MPSRAPCVLVLAEASADVPLKTVIAPVGVEINALESPRQLRGAGGLLRRSVRLLRRAVTLEM